MRDNHSAQLQIQTYFKITNFPQILFCQFLLLKMIFTSSVVLLINFAPQVTPLTEAELEAVTIVFHQYETGLREGTIYTRVSISLITKTFHQHDGGHHQIWGIIVTNKSKVDKYEMLLGEIQVFIARNMDGGDCSLQPGWNPLTINCFVMENPNTASFFHLLSSQNFRSSNLDFQQIII